MSLEATFVDTNILVYAHDSKDETRNLVARKLLADLWKTRSGVLSTQVLIEFYSVITRKLRPAIPAQEARAAVATYAEWCAIPTDPTLVIEASQLAEEHTLSFWDALIVAAAKRSGARLLLSEDLQHGRTFGYLRVENPFQS